VRSSTCRDLSKTERETGGKRDEEKGEKRAKHLLGGGWSSKRGRLFSREEGQVVG